METVAQMTKEELREMIATLIEQKLPNSSVILTKAYQ